MVGQVGCGKSTLLSALLGETEKLDGKVYVKVFVTIVKSLNSRNTVAEDLAWGYFRLKGNCERSCFNGQMKKNLKFVFNIELIIKN